MASSTVTPFVDAPQHSPRPLPLFLSLLQHHMASEAERAAVLAGLKAYQLAPRLAPPNAAPAIATIGNAVLRDYRAAQTKSERPVVFVPSLINPPNVLDLSERNSLLRWLADQGAWPLLIDWGSPTTAERDIDIGHHVTERLLPLLAKLPAPPILVGYCLGGTMALAAAALTPVAALGLIATPWHFGGFSDAAREDVATLWTGAERGCDALGVVPMEVLQAGFWRLDPERTLAKYARFGTLAPDSDLARGFVSLEDWSNGGAPLTYAAGRELFDDLYDADLTGTGRWHVGGVTIDPGTVACPAIEFVSATDRIVPAASSPRLADRRVIDAGHVGMIVGSRSRAQLWEPLADWLSSRDATR